jgi:hypothetical protein
MCTIAGILWLLWKRRTLMDLQNLPISAWQVRGTRRRIDSSEYDDNPTSVMIT